MKWRGDNELIAFYELSLLLFCLYPTILTCNDEYRRKMEGEDKVNGKRKMVLWIRQGGSEGGREGLD